MPDTPLRYASLPREELRAALRQPHSFEPPLRILAEDVLGADSSIDLVAVDPAGRIVLVLLAETDAEGEDGALLTRGLAQRAWVKPRLRDWLQLGPNLEISASAPVVARLLSPHFSPETRAAADAVGPDAIELWACRSVRNGAHVGVLLEPLTAPAAEAGLPTPSGPTGSFRSGLSEEDLGLTADEIRDFD